jgi:hypothetical protein
MSEKEIRKIIRSVCADLDHRAKRAAQTTARCVVLPTVMGLSLTVAGCPKNETDHLDAQVAAGEGGAVGGAGGFGGGGATTAAGGAGGSGQTRDSGAVAIYSAPLKDAGTKPDAAVKDAGPQVKYMAPTDAGAKPDSGAVALYSVPFIDAGAQAEYMAPLPDAGPQLRYMAQFPDAGAQLLYMAPTPKG